MVCMPIAEPAGAGLWPRVRAITGWPDSDEDALRTLATGWRTGGDRFTEASGFDLGGLNEGWPDAAGQGFATGTGERLRVAADTGTRMGELAGRAESYAAEVAGVKTGITRLMDANQAGWTQVSAMPVAAQEVFVQQVAVMVDTMMQEAAGRIAFAGGQAPDADLPEPPAGGSPADVRAWWDGLTVQQRSDLLRDQPELIGNLDGIPALTRNEANTTVLNREIAFLAQRQADLVNEGSAGGYAPDLVDGPIDIETVQTQLAGLRAIQNELLGRPADSQALLLGLDTSTDDGRAIIALGNPDTATDVATLVPGIFNDIGDIGGQIDRADSLGAGNGTATIAWLGYNTPDDLLQANDNGQAAAGAVDLASFQEGLRATHEGPPSHNTVVGHSYGSTVAGLAAREYGLAADDLVLVASTDPTVSTVNDYRLTGVPPELLGQRVHATTAGDDTTAGLGIFRHGNDPIDPGFGARVFETPEGGADPHSAAFDQGPALDEIRRIIEG